MDDKTVDKAEAIARLVDLHADGKITDEELETLRAEAAKPASNDSVALKLAVGLLALVGAIGLFVLLTNSDDSAEEESAPSTTVTEQPLTAPTSTLADEEPVVVPTTETAAQPTVPTTETVIKLPVWSDSTGNGSETWADKRSQLVTGALKRDQAWWMANLEANYNLRAGEFGTNPIAQCVVQNIQAESNLEEALMSRYYIKELPREIYNGKFVLEERPLDETRRRLIDKVYAPSNVRALIQQCS